MEKKHMKMDKELRENFQSLLAHFLTNHAEDVEGEIYRKLIGILPLQSLLSLGVNLLAYAVEDANERCGANDALEGYQEILKNLELECKPFIEVN